jgi:hypothetical protein
MVGYKTKIKEERTGLRGIQCAFASVRARMGRDCHPSHHNQHTLALGYLSSPLQHLPLSAFHHFLVVVVTTASCGILLGFPKAHCPFNIIPKSVAELLRLSPPILCKPGSVTSASCTCRATTLRLLRRGKNLGIGVGGGTVLEPDIKDPGFRTLAEVA